MSTLVITIIIASILIELALIGLGISWLLTGKSSLRPGACGRDPTKKKDECSKNSCDLCEREKPNDKLPKK